VLTNRLKEEVNAGRHPIMGCQQSDSWLYAEMMGKAGFDAIMLDMQHGPLDYKDMYAMMLALSASHATPVVRLPVNDTSIIPRLLDAGMLGLVYPMVNSAEEVERYVRASRYPPQGNRSLGPNRVGLDGLLEYVESANEAVMTIAQIETRAAFDNLEAIVATPGLDALFPGQADLAMDFGEPLVDLFSGRSLDRFQHIIETAHRGGLAVGCGAATPADGRTLLEIGADWLIVGPESYWLPPVIKQHHLDYRQVVSEYEGETIAAGAAGSSLGQE
jgi:4-hydroxy-2-oxoheptanedioate aldolase